MQIISPSYTNLQYGSWDLTINLKLQVGSRHPEFPFEILTNVVAELPSGMIRLPHVTIWGGLTTK